MCPPRCLVNNDRARIISITPLRVLCGWRAGEELCVGGGPHGCPPRGLLSPLRLGGGGEKKHAGRCAARSTGFCQPYGVLKKDGRASGLAKSRDGSHVSWWRGSCLSSLWVAAGGRARGRVVLLAQRPLERQLTGPRAGRDRLLPFSPDISSNVLQTLKPDSEIVCLQ